MILRHLRGGALALLVTAIAVFAAPAPGMESGLVRKTFHAWAGDYLWSFSNN